MRLFVVVCSIFVGACSAAPAATPKAGSSQPPPPAYLEPAKAGTRLSKTTELAPTSIARKARVIGCDIRYRNAPLGSSIFLKWFVYKDAEGYLAHDPINETAGKSQAVRGNGVINAYLAPTEDEAFEPGIYVCDFSLVEPGGETTRHEPAAIWIDPPKAP